MKPYYFKVENNDIYDDAYAYWKVTNRGLVLKSTSEDTSSWSKIISFDRMANFTVDSHKEYDINILTEEEYFLDRI